MTDHTDVEGAAQEALDAGLPRRSPQYAPALAYLTAYLQADAPTRRLAMRALKAKGIEANGAKETT